MTRRTPTTAATRTAGTSRRRRHLRYDAPPAPLFAFDSDEVRAALDAGWH